jgi:hypothetical protein
MVECQPGKAPTGTPTKDTEAMGSVRFRREEDDEAG